MKKKLLTMALAGSFIFGVAACGKDNTGDQDKQQEQQQINYQFEDGTYGYNVIDETNAKVEVAVVVAKDLKTATVPSKVTKDNKEYTVTKIGKSAFKDNDTISTITLPSTLTEIDDYAFYRLGRVYEVTVPFSVTRIGKHAFYYMGCNFQGGATTLTYVKLNASNPTAITQEHMLGEGLDVNSNQVRIVVRASALQNFKTAWSEYADFIVSQAN